MKVSKEVPIPEEVKVKVQSRRIWVEGPRGKLYRDFKHAMVTIKKTQNNTVLVEKRFEKKKRCAVVKSIAGHIRNLFVGVTQGFRYKMKLVYAHFPINATVMNEGKSLQVLNYIGQKDKRRINVRPGVKIVEPADGKDELWLEGNDIDAVSQSASSIWQSCRVTDKDIRKFLDGIYVYAKGPMDEEQPI
jgi:large subunit ribosomal protein L9e